MEDDWYKLFAEGYDTDEMVGLAFQNWLNDQIEAEEGLSVRAVIMMMFVLAVRLRPVFTEPELHSLVHFILDVAENTLDRDDAIVDMDTGESLTMLTAEELREMGDERPNAVVSFPLTVPEEWFNDGPSDQG